MEITPGKNGIAGLELFNAKGEKVNIYIDLKAKRVVMDRTQSGLTDFGKKAEPHDIEKAFDAQTIKRWSRDYAQTQCRELSKRLCFGHLGAT